MATERNALLLLALALGFLSPQVRAQQPQIPTLQVCNATQANGRGTVKIESRQDAQHSGTFDILFKLGCAPQSDGYPAGQIQMRSLSLTDSTVQGQIESTSIEQLTTTGRH